MADDIPLVAKATGRRIGQEHPAVFTSFNFSSCLRDKVYFSFFGYDNLYSRKTLEYFFTESRLSVTPS